MTNMMEKKLGEIESELYNLRSIIIKLIQQPEQKKIIRLKGLLKGTIVTEQDIKQSKKSLFEGS